jgi:hypothetical protein
MDVREQAERLEELLTQRDVRDAMRLRCDANGHEWENGCTVFLQVVKICKWCGERR